MTIELPYLIFLGDVQGDMFAKTAFGVRDWRPDACCAEWSLPSVKISLGLPKMSPVEAVATGAKSLLIGVAPVGGQIREEWIPALVEALEAGLDIVSGMHTRLESVAMIEETARKQGRSQHNVRHNDRSFPVGTGKNGRINVCLRLA